MVRSRKEIMEERIALRKSMMDGRGPHATSMPSMKEIVEEEVVADASEDEPDPVEVDVVDEAEAEEEGASCGDDALDSDDIGASDEQDDDALYAEDPAESFEERSDEPYDEADGSGSDDSGRGSGDVDEEVKAQAPKKRNTPKKGNARPAQIRDFPRSLLDLCKSYFPGATATEALAAYVLMKSGEFADDIPETVVALAKSGDDGDKVRELSDRVKRVEGKLDSMAQMERRILLAVGHLVANYDGFTRHVPTTPRDIDFLEETDGLFVRLAEQELRKHKADSASEGRPKKGASKKRKEER